MAEFFEDIPRAEDVVPGLREAKREAMRDVLVDALMMLISPQAMVTRKTLRTGPWKLATDMPFYDALLKKPRIGELGKIKWLTPRGYLKTTKVGFGKVFPKEGIGVRLERESADLSRVELELTKELSRDVIEGYSKAMGKGTKLPMPMLDFKNWPSQFAQEGRHRAAAAMQLGIKRLPVMIRKRVK